MKPAAEDQITPEQVVNIRPFELVAGLSSRPNVMEALDDLRSSMAYHYMAKKKYRSINSPLSDHTPTPGTSGKNDDDRQRNDYVATLDAMGVPAKTALLQYYADEEEIIARLDFIKLHPEKSLSLLKAVAPRVSTDEVQMAMDVIAKITKADPPLVEGNKKTVLDMAKKTLGEVVETLKGRGSHASSVINGDDTATGLPGH